MALGELLFGRRLRSEEEQVEQIGPSTGVPVLGLDALASAAYGPEAALTVLLPLGVVATSYIGPISLGIVALLLAVFFSYRQTIAAYPQGGGSYTVAKENLGLYAGLIAASALLTDYVLNVAVAISAGIGALVSAAPVLLPYTLPCCLGVLVLLTLLNLRGVRSAGLAFMLPTWLFVASLGGIIIVGAVKTLMAHGHPAPLVAPARLKSTVTAASLWLLLRAFASGCTALTGVEAVSNAVPVFRQPTVRLAQRTLTIIIAVLAFLVLGEAFLAHAYRINATPPGRQGYESVLSQLTGAVLGKGAFYYVSIGAIISVLALSANTSFAGFPRVCRLLALDEFLPAEFAHRGRRLVYTNGVVVLALLSAALLVVFGGITDRLIPLFAVGAFSAFSLSQLGMVAHWLKRRGAGTTHSLLLNGIGAIATSVTLVIIAVSKFKEGAWITIMVIPAVVLFLRWIRKYQEKLDKEIGQDGPLELETLSPPVIVVPIKRLDRVARKALRLAVTLSPEVLGVQIVAEEMKTAELSRRWHELVEEPAQSAGVVTPRLVVVPSVYREFYGPLIDYIRALGEEFPQRQIAVMVPEVVERHWYHFLFRHRATFMKGLLLLRGGPRIVLITTPWYPYDELRPQDGLGSKAAVCVRPGSRAVQGAR